MAGSEEKELGVGEREERETKKMGRGEKGGEKELGVKFGSQKLLAEVDWRKLSKAGSWSPCWSVPVREEYPSKRTNSYRES